jgi:hypothetical protein
MEIRPLKTDEEIAKAIRENYGDYSSYRNAQFDDPPLPKPQLVQKSAAELTSERKEYFAKAEGDAGGLSDQAS